MSVYLQTYTLNCGNDSPGQKSLMHLVAQIQDDSIDCALLHCQEAHKNKTIALLEKALEGSDWELSVGGFMPTHTKFKTQWHNHTGLLTLAIHRKDTRVSWDTQASQTVRRKPHRYQSGYNKGGLIQRLQLDTKKERFDILSINGHLDSGSLYKRYRDWYNIHKQLWPEVKNWQELAAFVPDSIVAGFDSNTRNALSYDGDEAVSLNLWNDPEIGEAKVFRQIPFGNQQASILASRSGLYQKDLFRPDPKRPGYALDGMLDVVSYQDPLFLNKETAPYRPIAPAPFHLPPEKGYQRDHCIIGSPPIWTKSCDAVTRVQNFLACQLYTLSPDLSFDILALDPNLACSKQRLLALYQLYFSSQGTFLSLLEQYISIAKQQMQTLACTASIMKSPARIVEKDDQAYSPFYFQKAQKAIHEQPAEPGLVPDKD